MKKPSEVKYSAPLPIDISIVESAFDSAIAIAESTGQWPAVVRHMRDMATTAQIEAAIVAYRAAGWRVEPGGRAARALISHPDQTQSTGGAP